MKKFPFFVLAVLSSIASVYAFSVSVPKPREFKSPSGDYRFVINPPELTTKESFLALAIGDYAGACMHEADAEHKSLVPYGILYYGAKSETRFWKRPLVNLVFPGEVILAETSNTLYIVTLGNWNPPVDRTGHEVVIYDRNARLIKTFNAEEIGISQKVLEEPYLWYSGYHLEPETATLAITLRESKKTIRISLRTGAILNTR